MVNYEQQEQLNHRGEDEISICVHKGFSYHVQ